MPRSSNVGHFKLLLALAHQAGLWILNGITWPRPPRRGTNSQHCIGVRLFFSWQSVDRAHANNLAIVNSQQVLSGARMDAEPGAADVLRRQLGLAALGLLRKALIVFSKFAP